MKSMDMLVHAERRGQLVNGLVRSVETRKYEGVDTECAVIDFDGIRGICKAKDFDSHQFRSLAGFVGHRVDVVITGNDPSGEVMVSRVEALEKLRENFWQTAEIGQVVQGKVSGWNRKTQTLFILVRGVTCYMSIRDWSYEYLPRVTDIARLGQPVTVRILELDWISQRVRVSRKELLEDPWVNAEERYKPGSLHLGMVATIHPRHGVFVKLQDGMDILCGLAKRLSKPAIGEPVTVKITRIDSKDRKGRGIVIHYPIKSF